MDAIEIGDLLAFAAIYDNRKAADPDVLAWLKAIGDLPYADAEDAVAAHYGETTERIMPGHVRARVKAMRRERLERAPLPPPSGELADQSGRYQKILQARIKQIADGKDLRNAIAAGPREGDPPAEWQARKAAVTPPPPPDPQAIARAQAAESRRRREESEAS